MWNQDEREGDGMPTTGPRSAEDAQRASACIGKSVVIKGEVLSSEDLVIDGCVEGTIKNSGHCLTISAGASIKANLVGRIIMISGAVKGTIAATELVAVRGTGSVDGDIRAPRIAISDGAILCGRVDTERAAAASEDQRLPLAV
jgi:cytoskeletal protein CcmA (bactofilin family)